MMKSKYAVALAALLSVSCNAFIVQQALCTASSPLFANHLDDKSHNNEDMKFTTAVDNGYSPPRDMKNVQFAGIRRMNSSHKSSSTQLRMADRNALIPDGGLSPCVIKVVGVGGGGCNAVSNLLIFI